MTILSIDPSINNIGWAIGTFSETRPGLILHACGTLRIKAGKRDGILARLGEIEAKLQGLLDRLSDYYDIDLCIYERPNSWIRNNTKSIDLLRRSIDCIIETVSGNRIPLKAIPVSDWKGNSTKISKLQFEAMFPGRKASEHARDAVMMAAWYERQMRISEMIEGE